MHRKRLAKHVVGVGRTTSKLETAIRRGAIDEATDDILVGAKDADLVIACVPIQSIVHSLEQASKVALPDAMLTDVGSTKQTIIQAAKGRLSDKQFLGSHPIAGGHHSCVEHATGTLLDSALVVMTPSQETCPDLVARMSGFWESMGSKITLLDALSHDQALAISSHLPHMVASALSLSTPHEFLPFVGKGWL
ncbi:MAG: prephenate dehydrogenase, partial [Pirellula sp.]